MSIDPEEEFLLDLRTTCTRDEAAAKLLGWMRGAVRRKLVRVTDSGIAPDELPTLYALDDSLPQHLAELRGAARSAILGAAESDNADRLLGEKHAALDEIDALIAKAHRILADIDDELAKGEASSLRIDQAATEQSGEASITLASLDRWAREKYGLSVLDAQDAVPADTPVSQASAADAPEAISATPAAESATQERIVNAAVERMGWDANEGQQWGRIKVENLLVTFAFALEDIVKRSGTRFLCNGKLNVKNLAQHLSDQTKPPSDECPLNSDGTDAAPDQGPLDGQSRESIMDRIEAAMNAKRKKLAGK